jgi:hypothetical protein
VYRRLDGVAVGRWQLVVSKETTAVWHTQEAKAGAVISTAIPAEPKVHAGLLCCCVSLPFNKPAAINTHHLTCTLP